MFTGQVTNITPFQYHYPGILAKLPRQLAVAHINGVNLLCSSAKKAIGETTRGGAHVHGHQSDHLQ